MPRKRKRPVKTIAPALHIFCEGEKTEPNYLEHYKDLFCHGAVAVVVERTEKNTPVQLVEEAIRCKRSGRVSPQDEYWVVYDRESPAKYAEKLHEEARTKAAANGIHIALSNVCFEVWLLLHRQKTCAACNSCDELMARKDFKAAFRGYEKGGACSVTSAEIDAARRNAEHMNQATLAGADKSWCVPSKWNPYTDVHRLLSAIDVFVAKLRESR